MVFTNRLKVKETSSFIHVIQMSAYYATMIICTKDILTFLNLGKGVNEIGSQKSKILDLVEQGTLLQNEIQFQQNVCKDCRSGCGKGSSEFYISQPQHVVRGNPIGGQP